MGDHFDEDILEDGKRVLNKVTFQALLLKHAQDWIAQFSASRLSSSPSGTRDTWRGTGPVRKGWWWVQQII